MDRLFDRKLEVLIIDTETFKEVAKFTEKFEIDFNIDRAEKGNPKLVIGISGLSMDTVLRLTKYTGYIRLFAGYSDYGTKKIFDGAIDTVVFEKTGNKNKVSITAYEGIKEGHKQKISLSVKHSRLFDVIKKIGKALKMPVDIVDDLENIRVDKYAYVGDSLKSMDNILDRYGYTWVIEKKVLKIKKKKDSKKVNVIKLTFDSGLLNYPVIGKVSVDGKDVSGYIVNCLLIPDIEVGGYVEIENDYLSGVFKIVELSTRGSTMGDDWNMQLKVVNI